MVCQFLLYNKVNQLYIYTCLHISSLLHLPPSHPRYPTPLGGDVCIFIPVLPLGSLEPFLFFFLDSIYMC